MKHKVICCCCGEKGIVEIDTKTGKIKGGWIYSGKIEVNFLKTNKCFYTPESIKEPLNNMKRITNKEYDPSAKRKYVEAWDCPICKNT